MKGKNFLTSMFAHWSKDEIEIASQKLEKQKAHSRRRGGAVCGILGSGEQTRIESCIIRIPESMVESHHSSPN
jgi:hypothetical protein